MFRVIDARIRVGLLSLFVKTMVGDVLFVCWGCSSSRLFHVVSFVSGCWWCFMCVVGRLACLLFWAGCRGA